MSVVERVMGGRKYIQVRRKVDKKQKQKFYPLAGLSPKEIAIIKNKANKLDKEWKLEQEKYNSYIGKFYQNGDFKYIKLTSPKHKNGWRIYFIKQNKGKPATSRSRSIDKNGLMSAFSEIYDELMKVLDYPQNTANYHFLKKIWYSHIKDVYMKKAKEYKVNN